MAKKRGPKVIWLCPQDYVWEKTRGDAKENCPHTWFECDNCAGLEKYVRADKK